MCHSMLTRARAAALTTLLPVAGACAGAAPDAAAPDVIYHGGKIVTLDERSTIADAVAVQDERIVAVGSADEVRRLAGPATRLVDLAGGTVLPGFSDNHIHLGRELQPWDGAMIEALPDWLRDADTMDRLLEAVRQRAAGTPPGEWIQGALAREIWPNQKVPTRWDLDDAAPGHAVALARGPHTLLLNSLALERAGITRDTPNPPGGWIIRDARGEPTGRVLETARRLVTRVMPADDAPASAPEWLERSRRQLRQLASLGITSVNVAGVRPDELGRVQTLYERWGDELPRATLQIRIRPGYDAFDDMEEAARVSIAELEGLGVRTGFGSDRLKIGAVKMSIDGGLSAPVFWSTEPYDGRPDFHGAQRIPDDVFHRVARRAHELGWQLGVHAIGDGAVVMVVNEMEKILRELPRADHRHYLHHVTVKPPPETLGKMAALDLLVASQPSFTVGLGAYAEEALDPVREATQNPVQSLRDLGIRVSFGSDAAPYGPLLAIWTAVTRRGWDEEVRGPDEAVSVEDALRLHTLEPAYLTFDEGMRGSIETGKLADLVVLGEDILSVDPDRIRRMAVERTIVGGREIYVSDR